MYCYKLNSMKVEYNDPDYARVDKHTGEITELRKSCTLPLEEFIMIYLQNIPEMYSLEGNQLKILMNCWRYCLQDPLYPGYNVVYPGPAFKAALRQNGLDLSSKSISVYISQLASKEFLLRLDRGVYALNPKYFYKGRLSDRSKLMLTFTCGYTQEELDELKIK